MKRSFELSEGEAASEMAIVDTFTKLIFGEESQYSDSELRIIESLRAVDVNVTADCHSEIGVYLRALGVSEMIALVTRVQSSMNSAAEHTAAHRDCAQPPGSLHDTH